MLTCSPNLSVNMPDRLAAIISATIQQNVVINFKPSANFKFQKKYITIQYTKNNTFLAIETIQKMILRLTETKMSKEKLAETLGITVKSLKQLCSKNASLELIPKINLPLIKLYCKTKF